MAASSASGIANGWDNITKSLQDQELLKEDEWDLFECWATVRRLELNNTSFLYGIGFMHPNDDAQKHFREEAMKITEDQQRRFALKGENIELEKALRRLAPLKKKFDEIANVLRAGEEDAVNGEGGWENILKQDKLEKHLGQS